MNLMKLFNLKYLMQNIKKSKMAIILFLSIVPIFTALTIILNNSYYYALEFYQLGLANIIFMYITPFILSFCLFGYVYKKKDIDFVCSMPISRKSIFVTNTIGGIILILISQFITFLLSWVLGLATGTMVFTGMIWDLFLYQTLAYIFMFAIANLAMTVSGNVITQMIVTILILFLIPATTFYYDLWQGSYYDLVDGNYTVNADYTIRNVRTYTAPSLIFGAVNSYWQYEPSTASALKMIILSVAYILIGYYLFEKKKMENAGESFEKPNTHFFVKALTLIPFAMILAPCIDEDEWEAALFLIAIVAVYYFIYDLITNKKHKFMKSLGMLALSLAVTTGVYGAVGKIAEDTDPKIEMDDIKSVTIEEIGSYMSGLDYEITDKEVFEVLLYEGGQNIYYDKYYYDSKVDIAYEPIPDDARKVERVRVLLTINMKNGTQKKTRIYINEELFYKVAEKTAYETTDVGIIQYKESVEFTSEEKVALKNALNNLFVEKKFDVLYEALNFGYYDSIRTYRYVGHEVQSFRFPVNTTKEIFEIITTAENRATSEFLRKRKNLELYMYVELYDGKIQFDYNGDCPTVVKEFVINHSGEKCNKDKEYITLTIDGVIKLIKETKEYKAYIQNGYGRVNYDKPVIYKEEVTDVFVEDSEIMYYPEATSDSMITVID